jgi:hypothetical protein
MNAGFTARPSRSRISASRRGTYTDASGVSGSVTISGDKMLFSGGHLNGRTGIYNGGNPPTISFYNADGEQILLCQLAR